MGPRISAAAKQVEGGTPAAQPTAAAGPGVAAKVFGTTTGLVATAVEVVLLTFLLLASGDTFLKKLLKVLRLKGEKRAALKIASETERAVSRYMVATALIKPARRARGRRHVAPAPSASAPLGRADLRARVRAVPRVAAMMIVLLAWPGWPRSTGWGMPPSRRRSI